MYFTLGLQTAYSFIIITAIFFIRLDISLTDTVSIFVLLNHAVNTTPTQNSKRRTRFVITETICSCTVIYVVMHPKK